jgi:glycosyltransferase involved in cell wall biosynthesis
MALVAPSTWMRDCARASALFRNRPIVEVIPNGLDTTQFHPLPQGSAREALGLPADKQLVLFGALGATSDANKGFDLLVPALRQLARDGWADRIHLVVVGARAPAETIDVGFPTTFLGRLYDDVSLILANSAADVAVIPSREESFGQSASEAHACGVPVVAFDTSGLRDIVQHGVTGYLARAFEPVDLAQGIRWVLENSARRATLGEAARSRAVQEFSIERVTQRYLDLYRRVLA